MNTHTNGSVTFGGAYTFTYTAASTVVATNGGSFSSCSTWNPATGCHLGAATPAWNGQLAAGCVGCHGYPPSTGTNHLDANRTGYANNDTTFMGAHGQCAICHGVAGDNVAYGTPPAGFGTPVDKIAVGGDAYVIGTNHGDGSVQMNGVSAPDNSQNTRYNETTWACDSAGCHASTVKFNSAGTNTVQLREFGKGGCDTCHGGGSVVGSNKNYWPDDSNTNAENDAQRHPLHMTKLALARYNETLTDLLTDNGNGTSNVKQVELCTLLPHQPRPGRRPRLTRPCRPT